MKQIFKLSRENDHVIIYHSIDNADIVLALSGADPLLYCEADIQTDVKEKQKQVSLFFTTNILSAKIKLRFTYMQF